MKDRLSKNDFDDIIQGLAEKYNPLALYENDSFTYEKPANLTIESPQQKLIREAFKAAKAQSLPVEEESFYVRAEEELRFAKKDAMRRAAMEDAKRQAMEETRIKNNLVDQIGGLSNRGGGLAGTEADRNRLGSSGNQQFSRQPFQGLRQDSVDDAWGWPPDAPGMKLRPISNSTPVPAPEPLRKGRMVLLKDPE